MARRLASARARLLDERRFHAGDGATFDKHVQCMGVTGEGHGQLMQGLDGVFPVADDLGGLVADAVVLAAQRQVILQRLIDVILQPGIDLADLVEAGMQARLVVHGGAEGGPEFLADLAGGEHAEGRAGGEDLFLGGFDLVHFLHQRFPAENGIRLILEE